MKNSPSVPCISHGHLSPCRVEECVTYISVNHLSLFIFFAFRQLLTGVDTLKFISQQLESIDRISDVHVHSEKS